MNYEHEGTPEQHETEASPAEMLAAVIAQNRALTAQIQTLTRRMAETGTSVTDDRPVDPQSPQEARAIFDQAYAAGRPRIAAIALAVQDRMSRQRNREEKRDAALVHFGDQFEKAERIRRLEKELEQARGASLDVAVEIPDGDES